MRVDTHVRAGYRIPPDYDSMIGKLIVHAPSRGEAIVRMRGALEEFKIGPIKTTIAIHRRLLEHRQFIEAEFDIQYVERFLKQETTDDRSPGAERRARAGSAVS